MASMSMAIFLPLAMLSERSYWGKAESLQQGAVLEANLFPSKAKEAGQGS